MKYLPDVCDHRLGQLEGTPTLQERSSFPIAQLKQCNTNFYEGQSENKIIKVNKSSRRLHGELNGTLSTMKPERTGIGFACNRNTLS